MIIIVIRVRREERMMLRRFGRDYSSYMGRTGRFLPTPGRPKHRKKPD